MDTFIEKPKKEEAPSNMAIIGRYIFMPSIFDELEKTQIGKKGEIQLTDAITSLSKKEVVYGKIMDGKRFDCGNKLGFLKATVEFALHDQNLKDEFEKYLKEVIKC